MRVATVVACGLLGALLATLIGLATAPPSDFAPAYPLWAIMGAVAGASGAGGALLFLRKRQL